jgi:NADH-quinone oxidoreductase subunit L
MRRMGGLKKYMPITYWTVLIGAFANAGLPPFAGFFSKDAILEAVQLSATPGAVFAYGALVAAVFAGGVYSFRLVFMTFHGEERMDAGTREHLHESPWVVTLPLVLLAIPSVASGWLIGTVLFGDYFDTAIRVLPGHPAMAEMAEEFHGILGYLGHGMTSLPFWLAAAGAATAWFLYIKNTHLPKKIAIAFGPLYALVERKYGFDELYTRLFATGARVIGAGLWKGGDQGIIDGLAVNGSARLVGWFSGVVRLLQSGLIYWYAFVMIFGVCAMYAVVKYRVFAGT